MRRKIGIYIMAGFVFLLCYPLIFIVLGSLMGEEELITHLAPVLVPDIQGFADWTFFPENWSVEAFQSLLSEDRGYFLHFRNSIKICLGIIIGQCLVSVPGAWAFARYEFWGKRILFSLYIIFMLLPFQVLMLPSYFVLRELSLLDTLWAIISPGVFSTLPVFLLYNFFKGIPEEVIEAGRIDGASEMQLFFRIGVPMGLPGISAVTVLQFLEYWNIIEQPMIFIEDPVKLPLSFYMPTIQIENISLALAAAVVTMLPSYLVFTWGQKSLQDGIAAIGMKK